ncbi:MAG: glycogen debranching enzyme family protein [Phycisphaeraceae bacterium]|nr:glycogen debranching enzyme family protein [Phycisphaeraceae bacterium]
MATKKRSGKSVAGSRGSGRPKVLSREPGQPVATGFGWTHQLEMGPDALSYLDHEWVLSNGTGAYAMGTAAGVNTRRYHGLLVACTHPPVGRVVALTQTLEKLTLQRGGAQQPLEFSSCLFKDGGAGRVVVPQGVGLLRQFSKGLAAQWEYSWGQCRLVRELHLHWQEQAATVRYLVQELSDSGSAARLAIGPMLTLRDFHAVLHEGGEKFAVETEEEGDVVHVSRGGVSVTMSCPGATFVPNEQWWYRIHLPGEMERGQEDLEDQFVPGWFEVQLEPRAEHEITLTVALGDEAVEPEVSDEGRRAHLRPMWERFRVPADGPAKHPGELQKQLLVMAADDFVVGRSYKGEKLKTILAGFPWFSDWGRDTFIALDGLLLCTGRLEEARDTLKVFAGAIRNGLVPNRFDDYDDTAAHYNTVDASLWYVHAAMRYLEVSGDRASWDGWLCAACLSIIDAYIKGTENEIRMAGDGLITAGNPGTQLTWMDAACGGVVFTPRCGKAVEINALWYHALAGMAELIATSHRQEADHLNRLTARIRRGFAKVFWDDSLGYAIDHVWTDGDGAEQRDGGLRPNQVLVASLPHSPLPRTKQQEILDAVGQKLLTPFGLRTLAPGHPAYHGHYAGDGFRRDEAYHQGTVWPWLIGPYAEGILRVGKFSNQARSEAMRVITPLLDEMTGRGLGQLHEIHEADVPHRPVGCMAQAWSVAEVLRVLTMIEGPAPKSGGGDD